MSGNNWRNETLEAESLECLKCSKPILGIFDYDVRDVCDPCGGSPKFTYDKDMNRVKTKQTKGTKREKRVKS